MTTAAKPNGTPSSTVMNAPCDAVAPAPAMPLRTRMALTLNENDEASESSAPNITPRLPRP